MIETGGMDAPFQVPLERKDSSFHSPHSIAFHLAQLLVVSVLVQVDSGPSAEEGQRALGRRVLPVLLQLLPRLLLRPPEDRRDQREHLEVGRVPPVVVARELADLGDALCDDLGAMCGHEDGLEQHNNKRHVLFSNLQCLFHASTRSLAWLFHAKSRPGGGEMGG